MLPFFIILLLLLLLPGLMAGLTIDMVQTAAAKLGFSPGVALVLLLAVFLGSAVNIPLYQKRGWLPYGPFRELLQPVSTVVAVNVGGGLIPTMLAIYQLFRGHLLATLATIVIVSLVSYCAAQVVPGTGIRMNAMVAPLCAVLCGWLLGGIAAPQVAFAGGILGTLIGADLLHLKELERMTPGVLSIGGAGIFDGIALCGLFSLLLV